MSSVRGVGIGCHHELGNLRHQVDVLSCFEVLLVIYSATCSAALCGMGIEKMIWPIKSMEMQSVLRFGIGILPRQKESTGGGKRTSLSSFPSVDIPCHGAILGFCLPTLDFLVLVVAAFWRSAWQYITTLS